MKKLFTFCTAIVVSSVLFTSCNKKLKEQMEDLESSMDEQKSKTETLQSQVGSLNNVLIRNPLTVSFSTTNGDDEAVAYSGSYSFVYGSDYTYSIMDDYENGTYGVYIWRGGDLGTDFMASIYFEYTPSTSTVSNIYVSTRGYGANGYYVNTSFNGTTNITQNLTVSAFDYSAGTVSFNYSGSTTAAYGNYYSGNPMNLTLSFTGSLVKGNISL